MCFMPSTFSSDSMGHNEAIDKGGIRSVTFNPKTRFLAYTCSATSNYKDAVS
jgi:hypothetical protein